MEKEKSWRPFQIVLLMEEIILDLLLHSMIPLGVVSMVLYHPFRPVQQAVVACRIESQV